MYATGHGIGVVKSVDGGASWTTKEKGLGSASTEALAIDGREPNRLYVWVLGDGLYLSDDAAESGQPVDEGPPQQTIRSLVPLIEQTGLGGISLYDGLHVCFVKFPGHLGGGDSQASQCITNQPKAE